jgi:GH24 family phage-related lysozyme (muramidase)
MPSLETLLEKHEGRRLDVYPDSQKRPTVGIGHRVRSEDKLKLKDTIDEDQLIAFFKKDTAIALAGAKSQASKAGIKDSDFVVYLACVNFQLGENWYKEHKKTWALIVEGQYSAAAEELKKSRWNSQTPKRTKDFIGALLQLTDKPAAKGKQ